MKKLISGVQDSVVDGKRAPDARFGYKGPEKWQMDQLLDELQIHDMKTGKMSWNLRAFKNNGRIKHLLYDGGQEGHHVVAYSLIVDALEKRLQNITPEDLVDLFCRHMDKTNQALVNSTYNNFHDHVQRLYHTLLKITYMPKGYNYLWDRLDAVKKSHAEMVQGSYACDHGHKSTLFKPNKQNAFFCEDVKTCPFLINIGLYLFQHLLAVQSLPLITLPNRFKGDQSLGRGEANAIKILSNLRSTAAREGVDQKWLAVNALSSLVDEEALSAQLIRYRGHETNVLAFYLLKLSQALHSYPDVRDLIFPNLKYGSFVLFEDTSTTVRLDQILFRKPQEAEEIASAKPHLPPSQIERAFQTKPYVPPKGLRQNSVADAMAQTDLPHQLQKPSDGFMDKQGIPPIEKRFDMLLAADQLINWLRREKIDLLAPRSADSYENRAKGVKASRNELT